MIGFLGLKEFNKEVDIEQWTEVGGERGSNREGSNRKRAMEPWKIPFAEGRSQSDFSMKELSLPTALGITEPCSGYPTIAVKAGRWQTQQSRVWTPRWTDPSLVTSPVPWSVGAESSYLENGIKDSICLNFKEKSAHWPKCHS